jgi:UDPglucose 6-dehydrogenase
MTGRNLSILGAGHVGLVYAAGMAELGHRVVCLDIDRHRIDDLAIGRLPIFEAGLDDAVQRQVSAGALRFTDSYDVALGEAEFVFIAVSTPSTADGAADLRAVRAAARAIAVAAGPRRPIIVNKSTVPVGTGDSVDHILAVANGHKGFRVVSNPEFLREGTALQDFFHPDRIVLGSRDRSASEEVSSLYEKIDAPVLITDVKTAEMIKYASNAFLATKISFINEIAEICVAVGADASEVSAGMGLDARIGPHFLRHGLGFGGSCLPKDVRALAYMGSVFGTHPQLLNAVLQINSAQRRRVLQKVRDPLGGLEGARICILGLAFKPDTDDVRDAPALDLIRLFQNEGAEVAAYDPQAIANARAVLPDAAYFDDAYDAAANADAIVLATEWAEFLDLDLEILRSCVANPLFIDGRDFLDAARLERAGFTVISGRERPSVATTRRNGRPAEVSA